MEIVKTITCPSCKMPQGWIKQAQCVFCHKAIVGFHIVSQLIAQKGV